MPDLIEAIVRTRARAAGIVADSLSDIHGASEKGVCGKILKGLSDTSELYPKGWYDPPPGGVAVLFDEKPYDRLKFDTLRAPEFFPSEKFRFGAESVGIIYASAVDKASGLLGDVGCTIYNGKDQKIREHIRKTYGAIISAAGHAEAGMKFSELYKFAIDSFGGESRVIAWMTTFHDPLKVNLGHTIPGSFGNDLPGANNFEELKEAIRTRRTYINAVEEFRIPETCAFTFEARLMDPQKPELPNVFVHYIVTFSAGQKRILADFEGIFKAAGMAEYMQ